MYETILLLIDKYEGIISIKTKSKGNKIEFDYDLNEVNEMTVKEWLQDIKDKSTY
jgi:hypothetical protein